MKSGAVLAMPTSIRRALVKLGSDLNIARRKRGLSVERMTQGAGISSSTLRRLEQGDPTVSIGALSMVLLVLGEQGRLSELVDLSTDTSGLLLDLDRLPRRIVERQSRGGL